MADLTSYVYAKDYQAGNAYGSYGWTTCDAGKRSDLIGGYAYSGKNWVVALKFTMPDNASSITLGFFTTSGANGGDDSSINYKVTTTEDSSTYKNATGAIAGDGTFTVKNPAARTELTINKVFRAGTTYYIYFWTAKDTSDTTNLFRPVWATNDNGKGFYATYIPIEQYELTVDASTGCSVSVSRTSSPIADAGMLADGATLYDGDVLAIAFSTETGYKLDAHTVNGATFASGGSHTVAAAVVIVAAASLQTFLLSLAANEGGTVAVNRTASSGGATGALADGATLYYGDVLTVTYSANAGYAADSATLNGAAIASGAEHTVTGAVAVAVVFDLSAGLVYISNGTTVEAYYIYIDNGTTWELFSAYIDNAAGWDMCS